MSYSSKGIRSGHHSKPKTGASLTLEIPAQHGGKAHQPHTTAGAFGRPIPGARGQGAGTGCRRREQVTVYGCVKVKFYILHRVYTWQCHEGYTECLTHGNVTRAAHDCLDMFGFLKALGKACVFREWAEKSADLTGQPRIGEGLNYGNRPR